MGSFTLSLGINLIFLGQVMIPSRCELFTALVHMEGLLQLEMELLSFLNSYIVAEKERLKELEIFSSRVSEAHSLYSGQPASTHLHDPINAFQLVNRYSNMWLKLQDNVYMENSKELMANISLNHYRLPTSDDFSGAIAALQRLQETYKLPTSSLASGKVSAAPSMTMTAKDCYVVGWEAYIAKNFLMSRDWMKEALTKYDEGNGPGFDDLDLAQVYDHLAFSEYQLGNMRKAAQYTRDLLQNEPTHERALASIAFFEGLKADQFVDAEVVETSEGGGWLDDTERDVYKAMCREGRPLPASEHHKLICYYFNNNRNPKLVIRPVKVEVLYPDPKIYVFRDILNDHEIDRLKELATPKLQRATARSHITGRYEHVNFRISKSGWLDSDDDPLGTVSSIDQRIEDMTGLTTSTAEQLQVVNYGIGGHYEPHYDFSRLGEYAYSRGLGTGNRVSTLLIYMSDVELGGATVFPGLGLRIPPSKGDAVYWWNLNKAGDGDLRTRHAGCPVLVGSKWVCNKWIHERGQEFRRPCSLSPDE